MLKCPCYGRRREPSWSGARMFWAAVPYVAFAALTLPYHGAAQQDRKPLMTRSIPSDGPLVAVAVLLRSDQHAATSPAQTPKPGKGNAILARQRRLKHQRPAPNSPATPESSTSLPARKQASLLLSSLCYTSLLFTHTNKRTPRSTFIMGLIKGGFLRLFQTLLYALAFCCAGIVLGMSQSTHCTIAFH